MIILMLNEIPQKENNINIEKEGENKLFLCVFKRRLHIRDIVAYIRTISPHFLLFIASCFLSSFSQQWPTTTDTSVFSLRGFKFCKNVSLSISTISMSHVFIFLLCNVFFTNFLFFVSQQFSMNFSMKGVLLTMLIFSRFECLFFSYSIYFFCILLQLKTVLSFVFNFLCKVSCFIAIDNVLI
jgi:hypothetical protein